MSAINVMSEKLEQVNEKLEQIKKALRGIAVEDMTKAEKQIWKILNNKS